MSCCRFVQSTYADGGDMSAEDVNTAERRACDTFCSTFSYVWFTGIDSKGQYMTVGGTMNAVLRERPFMALEVFRDLFGLSDELIQSFKEASLL
eukprot:scaffold289577_cov36-Prasinocladus_malaysianus.AAC.1